MPPSTAGSDSRRYATSDFGLNPALYLAQPPPRSPRMRLGGYFIRARVLDKGRAELANTAGEYR